MRIVFTGGGSGGHFYPIIAVAEALNRLVEEKRLLRPELYYIGPEPYDARALYENGIVFKASPAGKMRRYFSILNFFDLFKTGAGVVKAILQLYKLYPDVVFGKGGYASFPTLLAARLLRIPVIIHESDVVPGRVSAWAGTFARRIAISYPETAHYFKGKQVAHTGNPVRYELHLKAKEGGAEFLKLDKNIPTLLFLGGSQGAQVINDAVLDLLTDLVARYQVIHQTGTKNFEEVERTAKLILRQNEHAERYKPYAFLNPLALKMAAGAANVIISRAGSGSIFEIALFETPAILIPIPESISHDQKKNAYAYARHGGALVIEEPNLTPHLLLSEIHRILGDKALQASMISAAQSFAMPEAAKHIAEGILSLALEHER
jgi:UDP-N-acetylglucosamine--N-acetylmuramyl-(pentapeptide) pyrophosphoryl-undecaprenol N-acetylglucosamine transferase